MSAIRFGCCTALENAPLLADAGYDYIELGVRPALMPEAPEAEFEATARRIDAAPLPVAALAGLLPGDLKVVGPAVDWGRLSRYVETAVRRARRIGARILVFGSGPARSVPDGFPVQRAWAQVLDFLKMGGDAAARHHITLAVEPIRKAETNLLHLVSEGLALARQVDHPHVRCLADFYHMAEEGEPMEAIDPVGDWLVHAHIATPWGRKVPGSDRTDFSGFFAALRRIGYASGVSVECHYDDFRRDIRTAIQAIWTTSASSGTAPRQPYHLGRRDSVGD